MELERLSSDLSASSQIGPGDLEAIKAAGFRAIICNRPDGEAEGQPSFAEIRDAAAAIGIEARYVPVLASGVTEDNVSDFASAYRDLPRPALAYCRTGRRSATLWSRHVSQSKRDA